MHLVLQGYITELLEHYNPYTGLHYYEDPTILAFETGNELSGASTSALDPLFRRQQLSLLLSGLHRRRGLPSCSMDDQDRQLHPRRRLAPPHHRRHERDLELCVLSLPHYPLARADAPLAHTDTTGATAPGLGVAGIDIMTDHGVRPSLAAFSTCRRGSDSVPLARSTRATSASSTRSSRSPRRRARPSSSVRRRRRRRRRRRPRLVLTWPRC